MWLVCVCVPISMYMYYDNVYVICVCGNREKMEERKIIISRLNTINDIRIYMSRVGTLSISVYSVEIYVRECVKYIYLTSIYGFFPVLLSSLLRNYQIPKQSFIKLPRRNRKKKIK